MNAAQLLDQLRDISREQRHAMSRLRILVPAGNSDDRPKDIVEVRFIEEVGGVVIFSEDDL